MQLLAFDSSSEAERRAWFTAKFISSSGMGDGRALEAHLRTCSADYYTQLEKHDRVAA